MIRSFCEFQGATMKRSTRGFAHFAGRIALLLVLGAAVGLTEANAQTIYVDDGAPLGGDGTSWGTAFTYLQDALAAAAAGDEIRVAQGVYRERHAR